MSKFQVQSEQITRFFVMAEVEGVEVKHNFETEAEATEFAAKAEFGAEIAHEVNAFLNTNKLFGRRRAGTETIATSMAAFLKTWDGQDVEFDHEAAAAEAKAIADAAKAAETPAKVEGEEAAEEVVDGVSEDL